MADQAHRQAAPQQGKWKWRYLLLLGLMGLGVYLLLPQLVTFEHSLQVLRTLAWWAVSLAVVAQVLSYMGSGYLLQAIVAAAGQRLLVLRGTLIANASYSVGLVVGGDAGKRGGHLSLGTWQRRQCRGCRAGRLAARSGI